jgi:hypothetical protein
MWGARGVVCEEGRAIRGVGCLGGDLNQEDSLSKLHVLLGSLDRVSVGVHQVFEGLESLITHPLLAGEATSVSMVGVTMS